MEWLTRILDTVTKAHRIPPQVLCAIAAIAGTLLFLPTAWLKVLGLDTVATSWRPWLGFAFLISVVLLGLQTAGWCIDKCRQRSARAKRMTSIRNALVSLDKREQAVLREFPIQGQHTIQAPINDPVVAGLLQKQVLVTVGRISTEGFDWPVTLSDDALANITDAMMGLPKEMNDNVRQRILDSRPEWMPRDYY